MRLLIRQITISILASLHAAREVTSRICLLLPARHVFLPSSQQHNKPLERVPYESQHPHVVVMYIAKHGISSRHLSFPVREGERQTFSLSRSPTFPTSSCELLRERTGIGGEAIANRLPLYNPPFTQQRRHDSLGPWAFGK